MVRNACATDAARELIAYCEEVYEGDFNKKNDIQSNDNVVATYANTVVQKKYVHMYFAKYVGCWRAIRTPKKRLPT